MKNAKGGCGGKRIKGSTKSSVAKIIIKNLQTYGKRVPPKSNVKMKGHPGEGGAKTGRDMEGNKRKKISKYGMKQFLPGLGKHATVFYNWSRGHRG